MPLPGHGVPLCLFFRAVRQDALEEGQPAVQRDGVAEVE